MDLYTNELSSENRNSRRDVKGKKNKLIYKNERIKKLIGKMSTIVSFKCSRELHEQE